LITLGPLMLDLTSTTLTLEEVSLLKHSHVGGVILFSRNYENSEQLSRLTRSIRDCSENILIAVDHEGGRVQRFRENFSRIPPMAVFESNYKQSPERTLNDAELIGWLLAAELLVHGVDISFTPVLDRNYHCSQVIGDRAFSDSPKTISALAGALMTGMVSAGMAATGKHFPGHGAVNEDSHLDTPVDHRSLDVIRKKDLPPFKVLISQGIQGIMPAHIIYDQVDFLPAGFSRKWIKSELRHELDFNGVVFSDDLNMAGASVVGNFRQRAKAALDAGCDMVLVCNNRTGTYDVLDYLKESHYQTSAIPAVMLQRPILHEQGIHTFDELKHNQKWLSATKVLHQYL